MLSEDPPVGVSIFALFSLILSLYSLYLFVSDNSTYVTIGRGAVAVLTLCQCSATNGCDFGGDCFGGWGQWADSYSTKAGPSRAGESLDPAG
jgi:succinate-acetate transporter protein